MPRKPTYRKPSRAAGRKYEKLLTAHEEMVEREEGLVEETTEGLLTQTDEGKARSIMSMAEGGGAFGQEPVRVAKPMGVFERWWWTGLGLGLGLGIAIFVILVLLTVTAYVLPPSAYR